MGADPRDVAQEIYGSPDDGAVPPAAAGRAPGTAGAAPLEELLPLPWEPPIPFDDYKLPEFPTGALSDWLRDFVEAEARATQTPPDLAAMLALAVCAAACAKRLEIRLKDGWIEPLNLFTITVLPSGNRKSAVFRHLTAPLEEYEAAEAVRLAPAIADASARRRLAEARLKRLEAEIARTPR